jgi:hypothetical protein
VAREAGPERDARVQRIYRLAYARDPDANESKLAETFLAAGGSFADFCLAIVNANEFLYVD